MERPQIVAVLSTGRCGTQWLTAVLRDLYPAVLATHEPIGPLYRPRRYLRHPDPLAVLGEAEVAAHLTCVAASDAPYVETGWPLFSAVPAFAACFGSRLRIVHLTRHPVPSALSHLAHSSYAGSPRDDAYTRWATLGPDDPGVLAPEHADRWAQRSAYEKCLFWWTEVHAYALELRSSLRDVPWHTVSSEAMLGGDEATLRELVAFMGLDWEDAWLDRAGRVVDRWRHHTSLDIDPLAVERHPLTCAVAARLGYDASAVDVAALAARYRGAPDPGMDRIGRYGVT